MDITDVIDPIVAKSAADGESLLKAPEGWISVPNAIPPGHSRVKLPVSDLLPEAYRGKTVRAFSDWLPKFIEDHTTSWTLRTDLPRLPAVLIDRQTASRLVGIEHQMVWSHENGLVAIHIKRESSTQHFVHENILPCNYVNCRLVSASAQMCSGCKVARYCNTTCQKLDFQRHRDICRRFAEQKQCVADAKDTGVFVSREPTLPHDAAAPPADDPIKVDTDT